MAARNDVATIPAAGRTDRENARIEISGVTKRFLTPSGEAFTALRDVTFTVEPGQFCAVVGPTGCGKSTTLGLVSGLDKPSEGSVKVGGREVDGITDGISFMFQADALLPWKTVLGNVAMGPMFRGSARSRRTPRPGTGCAGSAWPASRTTTRTSSPAACASGWRWPPR